MRSFALFYLKCHVCHEIKNPFFLCWFTCKACGGMDNMCTVYDVNNRDASGAAKIVRELAGYEGFLSSCRFLDDTHIVTGSGDMKICVWDLEAGKKTAEMDGHLGDVVRSELISILFHDFLEIIPQFII